VAIPTPPPALWMVLFSVNSAVMRRRKVRSRRKKRTISATLTLRVARLEKANAIRCGSKNRTCSFSGTHRKRKVIMNQAAKKIPMALVSSSVLPE